MFKKKLKELKKLEVEMNQYRISDGADKDERSHDTPGKKKEEKNFR